MEFGKSKYELMYESLVERLRTVVLNPEFEDENVVRRISDFDFWPSKGMKISELTPMETFVRLVESVGRFQVAESKNTAKNNLTYSVSLARQLDFQLPGNDEAVKFFYQGTEYLMNNNQLLAEDVSKVLSKVYDERRFMESSTF